MPAPVAATDAFMDRAGAKASLNIPKKNINSDTLIIHIQATRLVDRHERTVLNFKIGSSPPLKNDTFKICLSCASVFQRY